MYKLLAGLVKERIDKAIDHLVTPTQDGFRKNHSTSEALFIARRFLDLRQREGSHICMLLLDWEKAFDKVNQRRMVHALHRFGIPEKICNVIKAIYKQRSL